MTSPSRLLAAVVGGVLTAAVAVATPASADNPPGPNDPIGALNSLVTGPAPRTVSAVGWAADPDDPAADADVLSLVDGRIVAHIATSIARPRISRRHALGPTPGFSLAVTLPDDSPHTVCVAVSNVGAGMSTVLGCIVTAGGSSTAGHDPLGTVDSASADADSVTVSGWSRDPDFRARRSVVVLYLDGSPAATVVTRRASAAQRAAGASPHGAFSITVPASSGAHLGCIWVVNTGLGSNSSLGCSAVDTRGPAGTGALPSVPHANRVATNEALSHIGGSYVWGAAGPRSFDCSGLVVYSYAKAGISLPHSSSMQFAAARAIPASRAVRGDLVFYHDSIGRVFHVGIYLGPGRSVAAIDTAEGVNYQSIYDSTATYGSMTHV